VSRCYRGMQNWALIVKMSIFLPLNEFFGYLHNFRAFISFPVSERDSRSKASDWDWVLCAIFDLMVLSHCLRGLWVEARASDARVLVGDDTACGEVREPDEAVSCVMSGSGQSRSLTRKVKLTYCMPILVVRFLLQILRTHSFLDPEVLPVAGMRGCLAAFKISCQ
jgi:hypothetical protein